MDTVIIYCIFLNSTIQYTIEHGWCPTKINHRLVIFNWNIGLEANKDFVELAVKIAKNMYLYFTQSS